MPPEDDFRRERDPRQQRRARVAGALAGVCLLAFGGGLWLAHGQTAPTPSPSPAPALSPSSRPLGVASLAPTPVPSQPVLGSGFSVAYDAASKQVVTFGGIDSYDVTWLWDGHHWTLARPSISPPGRFAAAAAYDPQTGVVMLFGGRLGPGQLVNDSWAWDGTTWRELDPGTGSVPSGEGARMAWDDTLKVMVLVTPDVGEGSGTWTWSGSRWLRQGGTELPMSTFLVGIAIEPSSGLLLGASCCSEGQGASATWTWNGAGWRQVVTRAQPAFTVGLVGDPMSSRILLFADPSVESGHDMWSWTGQDWRLVTGVPLPVFPAGAVADTGTGHVVILGSAAEPVQGRPQPVQIWSLSGTSWTQLGV